MQFQVKGRNLEVSDSIRSYAEEKLGKLERQLTDPRVEFELMLEKNPSIAENQVAEATIWTAGPGAAGERGVPPTCAPRSTSWSRSRAAGDPLPHARPRPPAAGGQGERRGGGDAGPWPTTSSWRSSRPSSSRSTR